MEEKRCLACMNIVMDDDMECPSCGCNLNKMAQLQDLEANIVLKDRFIVGLAQSRNGEGITYIAFDKVLGTKVLIKEFFPDTIVSRGENHIDVVINSGCDIKFKGLKADFIELSKKLAEFSGNQNIIDVQEIFEANNTVYVVTENLQGMNLSKYLIAQAGELSWQRAENMFLPLLYLIKSLNNVDVIHRAISPDTIIVRGNKLILTGFSISATRSTNSEIREEVFEGYASPEQYQRCAAHGTWTDVYGVCAVLYKVLTGTMPISAQQRNPQLDDLLEPEKLNPSIPKNVSVAIAKGLSYSASQRTQTIEQLIGELYFAQQENLDIITQVEPEEKKSKMPLWLKVILISLPITLALFGILYFIILGGKKTKPDDSSSSSTPSTSISSSSQQEKPSTSSASQDVTADYIVVENFEGKMYDDIKNTPAFTDVYKFVLKYEYSDDNKYGTVLKQDKEANSSIKKKSQIELTISKGPQQFFVPSYFDNNGIALTAEEYIAYLTKNGIQAIPFEVEDEVVDKGNVVDVQARVDGEQISIVAKTIDREQVKDVIVLISKGSND